MNNQDRAQLVYESLGNFLTKSGFKFDKNDAEKIINVTLTGEDFPVEIILLSGAEKQRLDVFSQLPFEIRREKAMDVAMAIANINARIAGGKFCLYLDKSVCSYESGMFFGELTGFGEEFAKEIISSAFTIIEKYNDQLYALNKGLISLKDLLSRNI